MNLPSNLAMNCRHFQRWFKDRRRRWCDGSIGKWALDGGGRTVPPRLPSTASSSGNGSTIDQGHESSEGAIHSNNNELESSGVAIHSSNDEIGSSGVAIHSNNNELESTRVAIPSNKNDTEPSGVAIPLNNNMESGKPCDTLCIKEEVAEEEEELAVDPSEEFEIDPSMYEVKIEVNPLFTG